jgi:aminoglycoside phosphotransferase (APT) family kinase protein
MWPQRAHEFAVARADREAAELLARVHAEYVPVVERLAGLPVTVIHGEFYASNVLVDDAERPDRVAPVDWEQTAVGPGPIDLAALASGRWNDEARAAIAAAYRETAPAAFDDLDLAACRLHLALQWLGWSESWSPPPEHRHDWLAEAAAAATLLGTVA